MKKYLSVTWRYIRNAWTVGIFILVILSVVSPPNYAHTPGFYHAPVKKSDLDLFNEMRKETHDSVEKTKHVNLEWVELK